MRKIEEHLSKDWYSLLSKEFTSPYYFKLVDFLSSEYAKEKEIFPKKSHIFECFNKTPFSEVKVIILGQDPYHGEGQANGLSFSVQNKMKIPPSLKNIFKELSSDLKGPPPLNGNLEKWAKQGVLLLNTVLTVEKAQANSHRNKGWEQFTDKIIELLSKEKNHLVFILWGGPAQKKGKSIDTKKHLVLKSTHPSPLSSYRGFFDSKPFSKTNSYLIKNKIGKINFLDH